MHLFRDQQARGPMFMARVGYQPVALNATTDSIKTQRSVEDQDTVGDHNVENGEP